MDKVLIGTKVRQAEVWLPRFITQIEQLKGNISRVVAIYGESNDKSYAYLNHWRNTSKHKIEIYAEPYLPPEEKHGFSLARVKQDMQRLLSEGDEDYYFNIDCDIVSIPQGTIHRLMNCNKDSVASMVWTEGRKQKTFFDTYVYRLNGCMFHPYEPPGLTKTEPFIVDSTSTCYLAKREVELAGTYTNPYPPIPFCDSLRRKGYQVWVDPLSSVWHYDLEKISVAHMPIDHPYSHVEYITDRGEKLSGRVVGAQRLQLEVENYAEKYGTTLERVWLDSRPLITASIKVLNDADFITYCLESIYPIVDRIDIVEGACKQAFHRADNTGHSTDNTVELIKAFPDPEHKIKLVQGVWNSKEEIQRKLLELCTSKWMMFIDADEILSDNAKEVIRGFCSKNQHGEQVYARPGQFYHFFHDFKHIAYSLNPLSPWYQFGQPHPFLIWRDISGLNFNYFHTMPINNLGFFVNTDRYFGGDPAYVGKQTILDDLKVFHFGNAKPEDQMKGKFIFERIRDRKNEPIETEFWFTGVMPIDMAIEEFTMQFPEVLLKHPWRDIAKIKVTEVKPQFKFERVKEAT